MKDDEQLSFDLDADGAPDLTRVLDRDTPFLGRDTGYELKTENQTLETSSTYGYSPTIGRLETVSGNRSGTFTYGYETNSSLIKTVTRPGLLETQPALRVTMKSGQSLCHGHFVMTLTASLNPSPAPPPPTHPTNTPSAPTSAIFPARS